MQSLKYKLKFLATNSYIFLITLICLFIKSLIFVAYISSSTGTKIAINKIPMYLISPTLYICLIIPFICFGYLFKGRKQYVAFLILNFIISFLMICDLIYYRGFQGFISPYNFSQSGNLDNLWSTIFSLLKPGDIFFVIDIVILLVIFLLGKSIYTKAKRHIALTCILFILGSSISYFYHYKYDIVENGANKRYFFIYWSPYYNVSNMSPIGYHIYDSYLYIKNSKKLVLKDSDKSAINIWYKNNKESLPDNKFKGIGKGKNLIVIQVESLENFLIGQKIEGQEITPNLNKLLKNSLYFSQIYEQVSGGNSSDADLMTNTSMYPVRSGSTFFRFPNNKYNSLPLIMKNTGYYTSAFHPDGGGYWNWMPALQSMGFDKCTDVTGFKLDEHIGLGLSDGSYLRQVAEKISTQPKPFYSFFVTLTSHMPFNLPKKYRELKLSPSLDKSVVGDYFQSVYYTDKHIGKFIDALDKKGLLNNSVIAIYGDHCGVHKYYKDKLSNIKPREDWWFKDNLRIPFILYSKDFKKEEFKTIGGQVDFMPTLCYMMGIDSSKYLTTIGRNLLNTNKDFVVLSSGKVLGKYKDEAEKQRIINGLDISDKLIRSDYFKNYIK